jgi:heat-inducible transcriptional repressor
MKPISNRKKEVLEAVINSYIENPEPVGSRSLVERYGFDCSSATVRHELSELEKSGYLTHVHSSSGRVPTDKGYRFYVDALMRTQSVDLGASNPLLGSQIRVLGQNIVYMLSRLNVVVSEVLDHTTIMAAPELVTEVLRVVRLIAVDINRVLVVLMDAVGVNCEFFLKLEHRFHQEDLDKISRLLTDKMQGRVLQDISEEDFASWVSALPELRGVCGTLYKEMSRFSAFRKSGSQVSVAGVSKMLRLPEFQNVAMAQRVVSTLEESQLLLGVFSEYMVARSPSVIIGSETGLESLRECSLVVAPFGRHTEQCGMLGVIGPKRMAYDFLVPMLQNITTLIDCELSQQSSANQL